MPSYSWSCPAGHDWVAFTSIASRNDPQTCKCGEPGHRTQWKDAPYLDRDSAGSWNSGSYNPGLGMVTSGIKDAERKAKARGMEPVGTEPVENLHKSFEKQREETREKRWRDADRVMLYGD